MTELWPDSNPPNKGEITDHKHWFIVVGDGPYRIRNFTKQQDLEGEYPTKELAHKMIRRIISSNPMYKM